MWSLRHDGGRQATESKLTSFFIIIILSVQEKKSRWFLIKRSKLKKFEIKEVKKMKKRTSDNASFIVIQVWLISLNSTH